MCLRRLAALTWRVVWGGKLRRQTLAAGGTRTRRDKCILEMILIKSLQSLEKPLYKWYYRVPFSPPSQGPTSTTLPTCPSPCPPPGGDGSIAPAAWIDNDARIMRCRVAAVSPPGPTGRSAEKFFLHANTRSHRELPHLDRNAKSNLRLCALFVA